jgi:hypothetical protein
MAFAASLCALCRLLTCNCDCTFNGPIDGDVDDFDPSGLNEITIETSGGNVDDFECLYFAEVCIEYLG